MDLEGRPEVLELKVVEDLEGCGGEGGVAYGAVGSGGLEEEGG